ncbi:hypothetical protein Sjap_007258 [Stephania japonica]|uniref:Uncharacterized protein n=1 Tax=Stephania japonica TaxID=461633 RepID=A0AAP0JML6_9MAGN
MHTPSSLYFLSSHGLSSYSSLTSISLPHLTTASALAGDRTRDAGGCRQPEVVGESRRTRQSLEVYYAGRDSSDRTESSRGKGPCLGDFL